MRAETLAQTQQVCYQGNKLAETMLRPFRERLWIGSYGSCGHSNARCTIMTHEHKIIGLSRGRVTPASWGL